MARIEMRDRLNEAGEMCCKEEAMLNVVIRTLDTKEFRLQVGLLRFRALAAGAMCGARVCRGAYSTGASSCVEYSVACGVCGRARVEKGGRVDESPGRVAGATGHVGRRAQEGGGQCHFDRS